MIRLCDFDKSFSLKVRGYEFADATGESDANWLDIEIIVAQECGDSWRQHGPYLQTFELNKLVSWLELISEAPKASRISFLEGELAFEYTNDSTLIVWLDFNFHPKGKEYDYSKNSEWSLVFLCSHSVLDGLVLGVRKIARNYPVR
jgi:hypothetical protein